MTAKIARGGSRARPKAKGRAKAKAPGLLDGLPIAAETLRKAGWWIVLGMVVAAAVAAIAAFRLPQLAGTAIGESVGDAGFSVRRVEVLGLKRMDRLPVYSVALDQQSMAMPLVDLDGTRERLLRFGWIKEARVSRRLPDTLVVDIVERQPAAIWQHNRQLSLIDTEGVVLEPVRLEAMPDLPLVIGPSANRHVAGLSGLLEGAPHLRPQLAGASWIGGRRWDLRFQTGEVLSLPEGAGPAGRALTTFARMDQQTQLLGRGFARFDMRIPGKFIVRISRQPGSRVPTTPPGAAPVIPATPPADLTETI